MFLEKEARVGRKDFNWATGQGHSLASATGWNTFLVKRYKRFYLHFRSKEKEGIKEYMDKLEELLIPKEEIHVEPETGDRRRPWTALRRKRIPRERRMLSNLVRQMRSTRKKWRQEEMVHQNEVQRRSYRRRRDKSQ